MLNLDLGVKEKFIVESIAGIQNRPQHVGLGPTLVRIVLNEHLTVTGNRHPLIYSVGRGRRGSEPQSPRLVWSEPLLNLATAESLEFLTQHVYPAFEFGHIGLLLLHFLLSGRFLLLRLIKLFRWFLWRTSFAA